MATLSLAEVGLDAVVNYSNAVSSLTPTAQYDAWALELGVSNTATTLAMDADDSAWSLPFGGSFLGGGYAGGSFSSEANIGLYKAAPTNTASAAATIPNISRAYLLTDNPDLLYSFHPLNIDCRSSLTKTQTANGVTIIYATFEYYNGGSGLTHVAIRIENGRVLCVVEAVQSQVDHYITLFSSANVIGTQTLLYTQAVGETQLIQLDYTIQPPTQGGSVFAGGLSSINAGQVLSTTQGASAFLSGKIGSVVLYAGAGLITSTYGTPTLKVGASLTPAVGIDLLSSTPASSIIGVNATVLNGNFTSVGMTPFMLSSGVVVFSGYQPFMGVVTILKPAIIGRNYICAINDAIIPISTLNQRVNSLGVSSLEITCPNGADYASIISARKSGDIIITAIEKTSLGDNAVVWQKYPISSISLQNGARHFSVSIRASATILNVNPKKVSVQGVSYISTDANGNRRVRCLPDNNLLPDDIAILPDLTEIKVLSITTTISSTSISMEFTDG